jgi:hypothetical protein
MSIVNEDKGCGEDELAGGMRRGDQEETRGNKEIIY